MELNSKHSNRGVNRVLWTIASSLFGGSLCAGICCGVTAQSRVLNCELVGEIADTQFSPDGTARRTRKYRFEIFLRGSHWLIRTTPVSNAADYSERYNEVGTDGTNSYAITVLNPEFDNRSVSLRVLQRIEQQLAEAEEQQALKDMAALKRQRDMVRRSALSSKKTGINDAVGRINPVAYPPFGPDLAAPLWLAYCSPAFLDRTSSERLPIMWVGPDASQNSSNDLAPVHFERSETAPRFLNHVSFLNDGYGFDLDKSKIVRTPLAPPFNLGYTNADYLVIATTNCNGVYVPSHARLSIYIPRKEARSLSDLSIIRVLDIRLAKYLEPCGRTSFVPVLPAIAAIQDNRDLNNKRQYLADAGPLLTTTNVTELQSFQRDVRNRYALLRERRKFIIAGLITVIISAPVLVWITRRLRNGDSVRNT